MASPVESLHVLHLDDHFVAVHKPAGLLVHRTAQDRSEETAALQLVRDQLDRHVYPVHRLDKPTSGVLLFGLAPEAAEAMATLLLRREVKKEYLALVRGWLESEGHIDYPLARTRDSRHPGPTRDAATSWLVVERFEIPTPVSRYPTARSTLVRLLPETGRTHQLRRHMKHVFHPVIGDRKYGDDAHNRLFSEAFGSDRLMLAAVRLAFRHPITGADLCIECRPADDFAITLKALAPYGVAPSPDWARKRSPSAGDGPSQVSEPPPQTRADPHPTFQP